MKQLTILVDMDDTIENLLDAWVKQVNSLYSTTVTVDDIKDWDISKAFPSLTREQVYAVTLQDDFWYHVSPRDGAVEALQRLISDGHRIVIVTSTDYQVVRAKMEGLLFRYFPFIRWNDVIITSQKQLIRGDVLVDDGVHNLLGGAYQKILMDSPNNRFFDAEANGMTRVKNWEEAYAAICAIADKPH